MEETQLSFWDWKGITDPLPPEPGLDDTIEPEEEEGEDATKQRQVKEDYR